MKYLFLTLVIVVQSAGPIRSVAKDIPSHCLLPQEFLFQKELVAQVPAPGNPGHTKPAPGVACVHNEKDASHNCNCHRECKPNIEIGQDGKPHDTITVQEDPKCRVYCFKDHCHCPAANCD